MDELRVITSTAVKDGGAGGGPPYRRGERGIGMVRVIKDFRYEGRRYHAPTGGREHRWAADHVAVLRDPQCFELCVDDDPSLAAESFTRAQIEGGLSARRGRTSDRTTSKPMHGLDYHGPRPGHESWRLR
jgi:hypothetical protein